MPFFTRQAIVPAAALLLATLATTNAQTCYYPDGKTVATSDVPCNPDAPASSCCGSGSFCLVGGLCVGGGLVTRGSCTDSSWGSACAQFCTDEEKSSAVPIAPCTSGSNSNKFVCGLDSTGCSGGNTFTLSSDTSLVLRPAQIAVLVSSSLQTTTTTASATVTAIPSGYFTGGAMAGLAIGIALPLLIALGVVYILLRRERNKFGNNSRQNKNLMYKLPDDHDDSVSLPRPPPITINSSTSSQGLHSPAAFHSNRNSHNSASASITNNSMTDPSPSRRASKWTIQTASSRPVVLSRDFPPNHSQTFLERYEAMKKSAQVRSEEVLPSPGLTQRSAPGTPVPQELDSKEKMDGVRYELSDTRMST